MPARLVARNTIYKQFLVRVGALLFFLDLHRVSFILTALLSFKHRLSRRTLSLPLAPVGTLATAPFQRT